MFCLFSDDGSNSSFWLLEGDAWTQALTKHLCHNAWATHETYGAHFAVITARLGVLAVDVHAAFPIAGRDFDAWRQELDQALDGDARATHCHGHPFDAPTRLFFVDFDYLHIVSLVLKYVLFNL
jgi:hypothetical protein